MVWMLGQTTVIGGLRLVLEEIAEKSVTIKELPPAPPPPDIGAEIDKRLLAVGFQRPGPFQII